MISPGRSERFFVSDLISDADRTEAQSRSFRSTGFLLLGASGLCGLIAWEKYRSATVTAKAFSDAVAIEGVDFKATVPVETWVAGAFCILLGIPALRCLTYWYRLSRTHVGEPPLLP
jgi:hypothetical protein